MSSVFVIGGSGFIGNAVARAFVHSGYTVYALTRSEDKAKSLRKDEIIPIVGKAQEPKGWEHIASSVDIIVEALSDFQDYTSAATVQKVLLDILSKHKNKIVIYTSGVWVCGNTTSPVDENTPTNPIDMVKSRPPFEKIYLDAGATVLRPGCVYGKQGSLFGMYFGQLKQGKGEFAGSANNEPYWAGVHVEDLADAYVRTVERGATLRGQVINLTSQPECVKTFLQNAAKILGFKGEIKFVEPKDPLSVALALSQRHISNAKAKLVLGWNPKFPSVSADTERYVRSWEAYQ